MVAVKHLYAGYGNPNDNLDLELTGDAVGNHLYQDLDNEDSVWMSYHSGGQHVGWQKLSFEGDFDIRTLGAVPHREGQFALSNTDELFISMGNPSANWELQWRSIGQLGDWYQEP